MDANERIREYEIIRLIGHGGMGSVYLARHIHLSSHAALKVLHEHLTDAPSVKQRFINEAKTLNDLQHPNIVFQKEFFEEQGRLILVMEYVDGRGLDQLIGQEVGPVPWERALAIFEQVLEGIGYAHSKGIIHRDIKPSNILITGESKVKIADLGIAKISGVEGVTKVGDLVGTPAYMAPEQIVDPDSVDHRIDIYSLGITLYEMVAGRHPFDSGDNVSEYALAKSVVDGNIPDPRTYYPHIPDWLVSVIMKSLSKDPDGRFQTCSEFLQAIRQGSSVGLPTENTEDLTPIGRTQPEVKGSYPSRPRMKYSRGWLAGVGFGGVAIISAILIVVLGQNGSQSSAEPSDRTEQTGQASTSPSETIVYPDPRVSHATAFDCCAPVSRGGNHWTYGPENLTDGNWDRAWSAPYQPGGAWFSIFLAENSTIGRISLVPGFVKENAVVEGLFSKNYRLKDVNIVFSNGQEVHHTFLDSPTMQDIVIDPPIVARSFTVNIESVYETMDYEDLAVSELEVSSE